MSIEPIPEILPEIEEGAAEVLDGLSAGIKQTVNYGTHVMKWCVDITAKGAGEEVIPLLLLFRNSLELLDSISILIKESSIDPCKILLRSLLESTLGVKYLLQKDTNRRAMCFMVWHIHNKIKNYQNLDPESQQGKQLRSKVKKDILINKMKIQKPPELEKLITNLEELLKEPSYAKIETEYQRLRKSGKSNPAWYSLFGGPNSLEELAERVEMSGMYELLYRPWSRSTHGTDIIDGKLSPSDKPGKVNIIQIRLPRDAQFVSSQALSLAFDLYRSFLKYFIPNKIEDFNNWYKLEIRDFYVGLTRGSILVVE